MVSTFRDQVTEFFAASVDVKSYDPRDNVYIWFGVLWGTPIPITTMLFEATLKEIDSIGEIVHLALTTPLQWFFLMHPLLFGMLFGILGNIRDRKDNKVESLIEELQHLSSIDPLTGLSNRRSFSQAFEGETARCRRNARPLSLLIIDLDHFKKVNDVYGHQVGDEVLSAMGRYLRTSSRPYDTVARWGGEEFVMLLPGADEKTAFDIAERIRTGLPSGLELSAPISPTVSTGISQYIDSDCLETLTERADKALYKAKADGRDRSVTWTEYESSMIKE